jgi:cysteine desulfurase
MDRIYLDWNATAPVLPQARDAMVDALSQVQGNASSVHHEGQIARTVVERARRSVAKAVNSPAQAVVLTGGATESNNQVLRHHVQVTDEPFIVCTAVEHPSVLEVVRDLEREGVRTAIWPVDERGRLDLEWLEETLAQGATLVSVMWANNEIGNINPIADICALIAQSDAVLHVDGTQALGRIPVDFNAAGIDYMTLSFHKMGGPKGIGAIVLREGVKVDALLSGGHQERGRRPGTENVPAAAALVATMDALVECGDEWRDELERKRALFLEALDAQVGQFEVRGDPEAMLPNTVNVAFEGIDGEDFLLAVDLAGVSASSGSACTAGSLEPSHVVLAMGFEHDDARRSVRFSFGPTTPDDALIEAIHRIGRVVDRLESLQA